MNLIAIVIVSLFVLFLLVGSSAQAPAPAPTPMIVWTQRGNSGSSGIGGMLAAIVLLVMLGLWLLGAQGNGKAQQYTPGSNDSAPAYVGQTQSAAIPSVVSFEEAHL